MLLQSLPDLAANPQINEGTAIIIFGILAVLLYAGVQLRSTLTLAVWFFSILSLVLSILMDFSFIYFWVAIVITSATLVVSIGVSYAYGQQV